MSDATTKEEMVLVTFRRLERSIGEDRYHMIHQTMDSAGKGLGFEYELKHWQQVDPRFISNFGAVPYSKELHEIVDKLVAQGKLRRNPESPIELNCSDN